MAIYKLIFQVFETMLALKPVVRCFFYFTVEPGWDLDRHPLYLLFRLAAS